MITPLQVEQLARMTGHIPWLTAQRPGIPDVSPTKRYASGKARGTARCNHRHRENVAKQDRAAARAKTAELCGNKPGYTLAHRDALVRKYRARIANALERQILDRENPLPFAKAMEFVP